MNYYNHSCEEHQIIFNKNTMKFSAEPEYKRENNIDYFSYVLNCCNMDLYICAAIVQGKAFAMEYVLERPVIYKGVFKVHKPGDYKVDISFVKEWSDKYNLSVTEISLGEFEDDDHYLYDSYEYISHRHYNYKITVFVNYETSQIIYNNSFNRIVNFGNDFYNENYKKINEAVLRLVDYDKNELKTMIDTGFYGAHIVLHKSSIDLYNRYKSYSIPLSDINIGELKNEKIICAFALGIEEYYNRLIERELWCRNNSITLIYINTDEIHIIVKKEVKNIDLFFKKQDFIEW